MEVEIREVTSREAEDVTDLIVRFREEHSRLLGGSKAVEREEVSNEVMATLKAEDKGYFVAVIEGEVVGYRSWEFRDEFYFTQELFVMPDYRQEGIAKALIRRLEDWLEERGQNIACIKCVPQNVAMINLARSEGYKILNQIELRKHLADELPEPRSEENALGYRWDIL